MKNWRTKSLLCIAVAMVGLSLGCQAANVQGDTTMPATAAATPTPGPATAPALAAVIAPTSDPFWGEWPAGTDPTEVGKRVVQNFLDRAKKGDKSIDSKSKNIGYPEGCLAYGSMRF